MSVIKTETNEALLDSIEEIFQETLSQLKKLHQEKLVLIKKFREENNLKELNKVRVALKERV